MFKLTAPQKNVVETDNFYKNTSISNIGGYAIFDNDVDFEIMKVAINKLIEKADGLRIHLSEENNETIQYIKEYEYQEVEVIEVKNDILSESNKWMETPFDLKGELYDFKLLRYHGRYGIFIKLHHVISDAWSMAIVLSKVIEYYDALRNCQELEVEIPSYTLFVNSEKEYLESEQYIKDKKYWDEKYLDKPTYISLSNENGIINAEGIRKSFVISKEEKEKIEAFCKESKVSMAVFFEAIVSLYAARINNADDITLCSLGFNRSGRTERKIVGMFNNILPMTVKIDWNKTFVELCQEITREHYEIFRHQKYPYENIMQSIKEKHGVSNIYDIMVSFQNARFDDNQETKYKSHWNFNGYAELSFMLNIDDLQNSGGLNINIDYKKEAFNDEEIEAIYNRLVCIIEQVIKNKKIAFKDIEIVTIEEKNKILYEFNDTKKEYPKEKRLYDYLEQQAIQTPDKIALRFEGNSITYKEFNEKVNSLANYLMSQKKLNDLDKNKDEIKNNEIIAIMLERSFDMLIGIYAIQKVGCAYMPIDPHFPKDRIEFMLEDSETSFVLTHNKWNNIIEDNSSNIEIVNLDEFKFDNYSKENLNLDVSSEDVAYVIYTSGSTGKPKGAQIQHHSVSNRIKWMHEKYPLNADDVILQKTPYTFDVSVWELFWWSMYGGSLQILIPEGHKDPKEIIDAVEKGKVTHMHFVPSMLNAFLEYLDNNKQLVDKLKTLKYVFASGEALQSEHVKKFYTLLGDNKTTLHNLYGPTECTVDVSYYDCPTQDIPDSIPIGRSIDNTQLLILDKACKLLPIGASGELHISGVLVGKGYIKRDELTKEKFIKNEYYDFPTIYKTGDLAKWLPDGNIEYLGRIDHQVKIRGLRVELGDIETAILKYPSMINCVVTVFEYLGEKYLCGYFTAKEKVNITSLKTELIKELPDYMVPSYFVQLEVMPLNNNGKIDRKALPKPDINAQEEYISPENEIEEKVQKCVEQVMKREKISVESDLLTSGLTSLGVITLITKLSTIDLDIKVRDFYENRTIRQIANIIQANQVKDYDYSEDEKYKDISDIINYEAPLKIVESDSSSVGNNILITGATGFLGIHLVDELYKKTDKKIYCLIRKVNKFEEFIKTYTDISLDEVEILSNHIENNNKNKRIIAIIGDITNGKLGLPEELYEQIKNDISDVIHSAANVSFFCSWEKAKSINYIGTCNIIKFAEDAKAKLHHISTMSVSGDILTGQTTMYPQFTEDKLYIGQLYKENVYAYSKYLAEREVIKAIRESRINANIYRLPNLTWRIKDGKFQKNFKENDLYLMTRVMYRLKKVPIEIQNENILLTPVDDLARAIITLMEGKKGNNVFHLVSTSSPTIKGYMEYLTDITSEPLKELYKQLNEMPNDEEMQFVAMYLAGILKDAEKLVVHVHSERTAKLLEELGYKWGTINNEYVRYVLKFDTDMK